MPLSESTKRNRDFGVNRARPDPFAGAKDTAQADEGNVGKLSIHCRAAPEELERQVTMQHVFVLLTTD